MARQGEGSPLTVRPVFYGLGMLSDTDKRLLEVAGGFYRYEGARDQAYRDITGWTATRAVQRVNALLDDPEAMKAHPMLVKRLRRLRTVRSRGRSRAG